MTPDEFFDEVLIPAFNDEPRVTAVDPSFVNAVTPGDSVWDVEMDGESFLIRVSKRP